MKALVVTFFLFYSSLSFGSILRCDKVSHGIDSQPDRKAFIDDQNVLLLILFPGIQLMFIDADTIHAYDMPTISFNRNDECKIQSQNFSDGLRHTITCRKRGGVKYDATLFINSDKSSAKITGSLSASPDSEANKINASFENCRIVTPKK